MVQLLIKIAILLFGNNWQSGLAAETGIADRTLRRWIAGTAPVPLGVWNDVLQLLSTRSSEIEHMRTRLAGLLPAPGKVLLQPIPNTRPDVDIDGVRFVLQKPDGNNIECFAQRGIFGDLGAQSTREMVILFQRCSDSFYRAASVKFELGEYGNRLNTIVLGPEDVIVTPNPDDTRASVLASRGIIDHPALAVRSVRPDDGLWRVAINGPGNPLTAIDVGGAVKLAQELRAIGEMDLASAIEKATGEARQAQREVF
ncbi:hypothetical protein AAFG13_06070 [Bradyrhizobium sp. B124]|uniref:hypothetical protein n=1 Tax=Bradyrhizobium sp. B124 TaxID=3140245 RepID=UPI0031841BD1